ncbi:Uma2 family endonuclease [Streptomyces sp. NPDC127098]|uniref:Uma2 family endonuclease n=1 Tax=Streptomyces sp. NPDC127098 TaxID=3347137 RepID=UPI003668584F
MPMPATVLEVPVSGVTEERDPGLELYERMEPIDGFTMEYLGGALVMMATPNTIHNRIVDLIRESLPRSEFQPWNDQAVAITGSNDRPDPDLTVTHADHADDYFKAVPSELVLFVLEVVSTTRGAKIRDYQEKPPIYAQGGIPVYLLVDPNDGTWLLHTEPSPEKGEYRTLRKGDFGDPVELPAPLDGIVVATDRFRRYPSDL